MYKEKYDIAAKTASELQTQLDEVTQLQHAVCEAHDVQVCLNFSRNYTDAVLLF